MRSQQEVLMNDGDEDTLVSILTYAFQSEGICQPVHDTPAGKGLSVSTVLDGKRKSLTSLEGVHVTFVTSLQTIIVKILTAVAWNLAKTGG